MTGREAIDIEADVETFSDFVKWLYRGPEVIKTYECHDLEEPFSRLWQLACRLEAEELKNQVVDYLQSLPFDEDFIGVLRRMWDIADSKAHAYMCEKVVYEIVDKGWADFIQATGRAWEFLMRDRQSCPLIERIKERLGDAYYNRSNGELMDPKTRMDCQWHEHTEKTRSECPRYQPEVRPTNVLKTEA